MNGLRSERSGGRTSRTEVPLEGKEEDGTKSRERSVVGGTCGRRHGVGDEGPFDWAPGHEGFLESGGPPSVTNSRLTYV